MLKIKKHFIILLFNILVNMYIFYTNKIIKLNFIYHYVLNLGVLIIRKL